MRLPWSVNISRPLFKLCQGTHKLESYTLKTWTCCKSKSRHTGGEGGRPLSVIQRSPLSMSIKCRPPLSVLNRRRRPLSMLNKCRRPLFILRASLLRHTYSLIILHNIKHVLVARVQTINCMATKVAPFPWSRETKFPLPANSVSSIHGNLALQSISASCTTPKHPKHPKHPKLPKHLVYLFRSIISKPTSAGVSLSSTIRRSNLLMNRHGLTWIQLRTSRTWT